MEKLALAIKDATTDLSGVHSETKWPGREGHEELARIVTKLLAHYPRTQDVVYTLEAYSQSLGSVPCFWLRKACKNLVDDPSVRWLPHVADIKQRAAKLHHEASNRAKHGLPYDPSGTRRQLNIGREIAKMRQGPVASGLPLLASGDG
jgi:hypothetical protein